MKKSKSGNLFLKRLYLTGLDVFGRNRGIGEFFLLVTLKTLHSWSLPFALVWHDQWFLLWRLCVIDDIFLMTVPHGEWFCPWLRPCKWQVLFGSPMNSNLTSQITMNHLNLTSSRSGREKLNPDWFLLRSLVAAFPILCIYFINILQFYLE